jgi:hypothetical protein
MLGGRKDENKFWQHLWTYRSTANLKRTAQWKVAWLGFFHSSRRDLRKLLQNFFFPW